MADHRIGKQEGFQKYFAGLLQKKANHNSHNPLVNFLKHFRQRYQDTRNPVKISHIDEDCSYMVLEDGSQWKLCANRQEIFWSTTERVMISAASKGGWRIEIYIIKNLDMNDEAQWTFDGYLKG